MVAEQQEINGLNIFFLSSLIFITILYYIIIIYFSIMNNTILNDKQDQHQEMKIEKLQQQTYYQFYRMSIQKQSYIIKVFPLSRVDYYQKELQILEKLEHPNIVKPLNQHSHIVGQLVNKLNCRVLVFPQAKNGNLMKYIEQHGGFSQEVAKIYLKRIIETLRYARDVAGIYHPNLTIDNILMKQDRDIELCGWSNSLQSTKKQLSFVIAKIAIQLITGRNPFPNKDIRSSPFSKFLTDKFIHKFWQQMQKSTKNRCKGFVSSQPFKNVIGLLLLNKISIFDEFLSYYLNEMFITVHEPFLYTNNQQLTEVC